MIHSARGVGTHSAFSATDNDKLIHKIRQKGNYDVLVVTTVMKLYIHIGIMVGPSGVDSIRFRPALIFQPKHANIFLNVLDDVLKEMNK